MNTSEKPSRRDQWQAIIDKQEQSGLTQAEYCKQNNLVLSKFTYHRGIIKASQRATSSKSDIFTPVKVTKIEQTPSSDIRILLPNGFQCFVPSHVDALHVKRLMEVLLAC